MTRIPRFRLACLFLSFAAVLHGQSQANAGSNASPVAITLGQSAVPLYGPWKFTVGDSPIDPETGKPPWAEADFDDSKWETIYLTPPMKGTVVPDLLLFGSVPGWTARGHAGYSGYAWYRIRVQVENPAPQPLAMVGPFNVEDVYQAFADGELLGSFGKFTGSRPVVYLNRPVIFRLPEPRKATTGSRVLAFRFWMIPASLYNSPDAGGVRYAPVLGELRAVALAYQAQWIKVIRLSLVDAIIALVVGVLALVAFSLILFDRSDPVYIWLGLALLATAMTFGLGPIDGWTEFMSFTTNLLFQDVAGPLAGAVWTIVWWVWFGRTAGRWIPWVVGGYLVLLILFRILSQGVIFGIVSHDVALHFLEADWVFPIVIGGLQLWIVADGIRRRGLEGWLVLPAVVLGRASYIWSSLTPQFIRYQWSPFGVRVHIFQIVYLLNVAVIALLLLRRLLQSLKRQKQMALDVKSAQEVQQVILPQQRVVLSGFEIESEYRPAREVGGDFFQIIPNAQDGSLLIVAGDVSGKGLRAGMLVALLIGAIRTAARFSPDPVKILSELNQRLLGRGDDRATCLAMRIDRDGAVTLANAGHLPPYLNGAPVEIEGSLPLGLIEAFDPSVLQFHMSPGDRVLLLSDGIAEATNKQGHLFGFDRVLELVRTQPTAAKIVETAQAFGQDDDISVIAVTRSGAAEPAMA